MNIQAHLFPRYLRRPVVQEPEPQAILNPRLQELHDLWNSKRENRIAPARSDFTIGEFRPWLGHLLILDNVGSRDRIRYRLYGSKLVELFGFDLTNRTVLDSMLLIGDRALIEYETVARLGQPVHVSRYTPTAKRHIQVDKLALPLISDGHVDQILAAIYPSQQEGDS
ncbi:MAG: PAS domain-containing protein [Ferrovibrio sp.]